MAQLQLVAVASVLLGLGLAVLLWGIYRFSTAESPQQRLERLTSSPHPTEEAEQSLPFVERVIAPWLRQQIKGAGRLAPSRNVDKLRLMLAQAGYPYNLGLLDLLGIKVLTAAASAGIVMGMSTLGSSAPISGIILGLTMGVIGFMAPDFWLGSKVRKRKKEITRALPEALDMLTICVDAGAGFDSAMLKISEKWKNAIATELGKVVAEIRIGITRREALQNMVRRTDVSDVANFVAVLVQSEQFGLSISDVLHSQSEQMRIKRWQRVEEEVRKVPIKLLFPLVFMIFPAMLAVTIGPAVPVIIGMFSQLSGR
jgi:tight adherence protein C